MDAIRLIEIVLLVVGFLSVHFFRTSKEIDKDIQVDIEKLREKHQALSVQFSGHASALVTQVSALEKALGGFTAELKDLRNEFKEFRRELHNGSERLRGVT